LGAIISTRRRDASISISKHRRTTHNLRSASSTRVAKTFLLTKTFHAHNTNFLRQEKSIRNHVDELVGRI